MQRNQILQGDCVKLMQSLPEACVDLAFADPPFNIGYEYDLYEDRLGYQQYLDWTRTWTAAVIRLLKPNGTFWLAIGDEYAAELKLILQEQGLICRSWVIWYYTFGVNCKQKFTRSHAHLFHMVKDARNFTFNTEEIRVPSARQLVYGDKRANPKGRLPDDTWILRPQDLPDRFEPTSDTWYIPRVNGTFSERSGWHGCQMPERLLERVIRCSSDVGQLVFDPFSGSGTTLCVAKKLGRDYLGCDISPDYVQQGAERLAKTNVGDEPAGAADPLRSAPTTAAGRKLKDPQQTEIETHKRAKNSSERK